MSSNKFNNGVQSVAESQFDNFMLNKSSSSSIPNLLVKRDDNGDFQCGNMNNSLFGVIDNSLRANRLVVGSVSNGGTSSLPTGNWMGEIFLVYGNSSGRVSVRKYAFRKDTGGNGWFNQIYHYFVGSTDSSISFNSTTGVFTYNLVPSFGSVSGKIFLNYFSI